MAHLGLLFCEDMKVMQNIKYFIHIWFFWISLYLSTLRILYFLELSPSFSQNFRTSFSSNVFFYSQHAKSISFIHMIHKTGTLTLQIGKLKQEIHQKTEEMHRYQQQTEQV